MNKGDLIIGKDSKLCMTTDGRIVTYAPHQIDPDILIDGNRLADFFDPSNMLPCSVTTERWNFDIRYKGGEETNYDTPVSVSRELVGTYTFPNVVDEDGNDLVVCDQDQYKYRTVNYSYIDSNGVSNSNRVNIGTAYSANDLSRLYMTMVPVVGSQIGAMRGWDGVYNAFWDVRLAGLAGVSVPSGGFTAYVRPVFDYKCIMKRPESREIYLEQRKIHSYDISHVIWSPNLYCTIDDRRNLDTFVELYGSEAGYGPGNHTARTCNGNGIFSKTDDDRIRFDEDTRSFKFTNESGLFPILPVFTTGDFSFTRVIVRDGSMTTVTSKTVCPAPTFTSGTGDFPRSGYFALNGSLRFPEMTIRRTYI